MATGKFQRFILNIFIIQVLFESTYDRQYFPWDFIEFMSYLHAVLFCFFPVKHSRIEIDVNPFI